MSDLADFAIKVSGLTQPTTGGRLSRERAAGLDEHLRDLDRARRQAWKELEIAP